MPLRRQFLGSSALLACILAAKAQGGPLDNFSESVVFLNHNEPLKEKLNGTEYEIWLKGPGAPPIFTPKLVQVSGSGLIVVSSNVAYLVTAKHVALDMTENFEIVMRGGHREPLHFSLAALTGQPSVKWFHHPEADVSVHPLPTVTRDGLAAL